MSESTPKIIIVTPAELVKMRLRDNFYPVERYASQVPVPGEVGRLVERMEIDFLANGVKLIHRAGTLAILVEASHE